MSSSAVVNSKEEEKKDNSEQEKNWVTLPSGADDEASIRSLKGEINVKVQDEVIPAMALVVDSSQDEYLTDPAIQKLVQGWQTNVQEPIQKGLETHVQPHVQKLQQELEKHVQPHMQKVGDSVKTLQSNTKAAVDEHVAPKWNQIASSTQKQWETVHTGTRALLDEHVQPKLVQVQQSTQQGFEASGKFVKSIPVHSQRVMDEHVTPKFVEWKDKTSQGLEGISTATKETYQTKVAPFVSNLQDTKYRKYYWNRAPGLFAEDETRISLVVLEASLRSMSKVCSCDNPVTGACVGVAMLCANPLVGLCAMTSVAAQSAWANYLHMDHVKSGDWGANAVLVGAGCAALIEWSSQLWAHWLAALALSSIVLPPMTLLAQVHLTQHVMPTGTPPLLLPYNFIMTMTLLAAMMWSPVTLVVSTAAEEEVGYSIITSTLNGFSAIFLVQGWAAGLLIATGVFLCSRYLACAMLGASMSASFLGLLVGIPLASVDAGVAGYQAALTAAAMVYYFEPSGTEVAVMLFAVLGTCLLQAATGALFLQVFGVPMSLTFAFCFAMIPILSLDAEKVFGRGGFLKRIPAESLSTPEEYLLAVSDSSPSESKKDDECATTLDKPDESDKKKVETVTNETTPLIAKEGMDV